MGKLTLKAIGVLLKKIAYIAKKYTDFKISANSVHLYEKATANNGYLKTYILSTALTLAAVTSANTIGEIDIPKDFLLKGKSLLTVVAGTGANEGKFMVTEVNNVAVAEAYEANAQVNAEGTWLDLVINTRDDSETAQHVLVNLTKFIDIYSNGNGIDLNNKIFSIKLKMVDDANLSGLAFDASGALLINIDANNANGLAVTADGLKLALAQASTDGVGGAAGAMSAADKENLDGLVEDMDMDLLNDAELASWFGYDITGTPAEGSEAETIKTGLTNLSTDSITDEPGA